MSRHPQIVPPVENDTPVETSQDLQGNSIRTSCENGSNCVVGTRGCVGGKRVDMLNNPNCIKEETEPSDHADTNGSEEEWTSDRGVENRSVANANVLSDDGGNSCANDSAVLPVWISLSVHGVGVPCKPDRSSVDIQPVLPIANGGRDAAIATASHG